MKVSLIKCESYNQNEVQEAVKKSIDLIGGMESFVKPGERILLKPNLLGARQPERAVTTHPEVVRAVIKLVKQAKAVPLLGDSPGGAVKGVERVWIETGMKKVAEEEGVKLVNFETSGSVEKKINHPQLHSIHIAKIIEEVDGIINLPKLKTHSLVIYTGAIKNLYGCIPGLRKAEYHKLVPFPNDFSRLLDEIYLVVKNKIRFSLIDGIVGMEGNGPNSGEKRKMDMITAGADAVALDFIITNLLGLNPKKIESIHYLAKQKIEKNYAEKIEILGNKPEEFNLSKFAFPSNWYINLVPGWIVRFLRKYIWLKPLIIPEICTNCMLCVNSCPVKAIKKEGTNKPEVINDECITCLCCHELCPSKAIELKRSFLAKFLIR
ncbi:MAG: DUF362 domain-containing protein [Endomicrobiales bacterium]|nr:DUF362 domain-containing protein [Endomicrobiales bacterium]